MSLKSWHDFVLHSWKSRLDTKESPCNRMARCNAAMWHNEVAWCCVVSYFSGPLPMSNRNAPQHPYSHALPPFLSLSLAHQVAILLLVCLLYHYKLVHVKLLHVRMLELCTVSCKKVILWSRQNWQPVWIPYTLCGDLGPPQPCLTTSWNNNGLPHLTVLSWELN